MQVLIPEMFKDARMPLGIRAVVFDGAVDVLPENVSDVEIFIPTYMGPDSAYEPISRLPNLRYVLLMSAGVDKALPYMRPGITLCNARGVHNAPTAELTLALALASYRNLANYIRAKEDYWKHRKTERTLSSANVVIVGAGSIGREIARLFEAFGALTSYVSRSGSNGTIPLSHAATVIGNADIVVVVVPLTPDTIGMIDKDFLAQLRDGALIVNVARGEVLDTDALVNELSTGRISAALDVTNPEPLPDNHPIWRLNNCVVSPHVGGVTDSFLPKALDLIEENLELIASRKEPNHIINGSY